MTRKEAEEAVRSLLLWIGEDPQREGLRETPKRVVKAFEEYFKGYQQDPIEILSTTFEDVDGYDDLILLRDIPFESHCEHHMSPIVGVAHIAYLPNGRVVGLSKLARLVDVYAKRLQIQEKMTRQIAHALNTVLKPLGVAVMIEATHHCMTTRGIHKTGSRMVTSHMEGAFRDNPLTRKEILSLLKGS